MLLRAIYSGTHQDVGGLHKGICALFRGIVFAGLRLSINYWKHGGSRAELSSGIYAPRSENVRLAMSVQ